MSTSLELDAPAKLNLFLEVCGRRPDGYHEIDSIFCAIDLCDRIRLERSDTLELTLSGEPVPGGAGNLAWRAAEALGVAAGIHLEKRIPPGSGLGGGSSDAAAVLRGLDRLYGLATPERRLHELAAGLGADVPFFLTGGTARCRGIGERVESVAAAPGTGFLLVVPDLQMSTERIFSAFGPGLTGNRQIATVFLQKYLRREMGRPPYFNRLQEVAETVEPRLRRIREGAERELGVVLTMTGSGSAYFAEMGEEVTGDRREFGGEPARVWTARSI